MPLPEIRFLLSRLFALQHSNAPAPPRAQRLASVPRASLCIQRDAGLAKIDPPTPTPRSRKKPRPAALSLPFPLFLGAVLHPPPTQRMAKREEHLAILTSDSGLPVHEVARRLVTPKHPWLIDPRTSRRIGYWDMITSVCCTAIARAMCPTQLSCNQAVACKGRLLSRGMRRPLSARLRSDAMSASRVRSVCHPLACALSRWR